MVTSSFLKGSWWDRRKILWPICISCLAIENMYCAVKTHWLRQRVHHSKASTHNIVTLAEANSFSSPLSLADCWFSRCAHPRLLAASASHVVKNCNMLRKNLACTSINKSSWCTVAHAPNWMIFVIAIGPSAVNICINTQTAERLSNTQSLC